MPALQKAGATGGKSPHSRAALLIAVTSLLAGCAAPAGDFGRPRATAPLFGSIPEKIARWKGEAGPEIGQTLPEDNLLNRLPHFRQTEPALPPEPVARANALADRIAIDHALSEEITALRPDLAEKARIRAGARAAFGAAHPKAAAMGADRDAMDAALLAEHCRRLSERTAANRSALEELVLVAPEVAVVGAERQLIALEEWLPVFCGGTPYARPAPHPAAPGAKRRVVVKS
ncbi:MAG: hypothetical protein LCH61_09155 [Proteobacteria bacterium]|nr:hypothetical protein [Pseudomonadota bacterium]